MQLKKDVDRLSEELDTTKTEAKRVAEVLDRLKGQAARLKKWQGIADADEHAARLVRDAETRFKEALESAERIRVTAQQHADALILAAQNESSSLTADAQKTLKVTERTLRALQNQIEGYGDQYLIPPHSLLDELANDFSHKQAGVELKRARDLTRLMIQNGTAGCCSYVEANRRSTAVNFVVDAFNGKVDSILSRVKSDNAGTLRQEIQDAFALVNVNGSAFRDASITEEFLAARLAELKWAAIAQQLKLDEREEQRRIKEQIRDEEKARKEYERAIREAAKEEDLIRRALEKAQSQLDHATAQQRANYERQIEELNQRLTDAESRNQRALSMAQQTKRGHVYVISNVGSFGEHVYKIGLTRRLEPLDRVKELGDSSVPFEFDVHALLFSEDAPALEHQLHKHFVTMQVNKVNYRKEFFRVDLAHIRDEIEALGLTAQWTMTAQAREYRETLAIEKTIQEDPARREAWIARQLALDLSANSFDEPTESDEVSNAAAEATFTT